MAKKVTQLNEQNRSFLKSKTAASLSSQPSKDGLTDRQIIAKLYEGQMVLFEWLKNTQGEVNDALNTEVFASTDDIFITEMYFDNFDYSHGVCLFGQSSNLVMKTSPIKQDIIDLLNGLEPNMKLALTFHYNPHMKRQLRKNRFAYPNNWIQQGNEQFREDLGIPSKYLSEKQIEQYTNLIFELDASSITYDALGNAYLKITIPHFEEYVLFKNYCFNLEDDCIANNYINHEMISDGSFHLGEQLTRCVSSIDGASLPFAPIFFTDWNNKNRKRGIALGKRSGNVVRVNYVTDGEAFLRAARIPTLRDKKKNHIALSVFNGPDSYDNVNYLSIQYESRLPAHIKYIPLALQPKIVILNSNYKDKEVNRIFIKKYSSTSKFIAVTPHIFKDVTQSNENTLSTIWVLKYRIKE